MKPCKRATQQLLAEIDTTATSKAGEQFLARRRRRPLQQLLHAWPTDEKQTHTDRSTGQATRPPAVQEPASTVQQCAAGLRAMLRRRRRRRRRRRCCCCCTL